jgi:ketosteroid isomerase-like protein
MTSRPRAEEESVADPKVETIQKVYEAFGRGDVATIVDQVTDDVDWASEAGSKDAPWHGVHKGKGEVPKFFEAIATSIDVTEFTPLSFAANDTDVMVVIRFAMTAKATGKSGAMDLHHWWQFRDGKIARYRGTEDTALVAELLRS